VVVAVVELFLVVVERVRLDMQPYHQFQRLLEFILLLLVLVEMEAMVIYLLMLQMVVTLHLDH
jgi:hypothetical protein